MGVTQLLAPLCVYTRQVLDHVGAAGVRGTARDVAWPKSVALAFSSNCQYLWMKDLDYAAASA
jgi:hypothetical protein